MKKILDQVVTVLTLVVISYVAWQLRPKPVPAPKAVHLVGLEKEPTYGPASAPTTVVIFSDYSCPYCKKAEATGIVKDIKKLADAGKVRYIFQDFPLAMHKDAIKQAQAGRCAWELGVQAWSVAQTFLFANGAIPAALASCVESGAHKPLVTASMDRGKSIGITGTPSFIVGKTIAGGVEGLLYLGDLKLDQIK